MRVAVCAMLISVLATAAAGQSGNAVLTAARQAAEKADFRATGHLVRVDPGGARTSYPIAVKAHWFPGVLRIMLEVSQPSGSPPASPNSAPLHVLLELRPSGQPTIKVAHKGDHEATSLPVERWTEGVAGTGFTYEDFLEQQYFWAGQSVTEHVKYGARDTDLVKSTPRTFRSNWVLRSPVMAGQHDILSRICRKDNEKDSARAGIYLFWASA